MALASSSPRDTPRARPVRTRSAVSRHGDGACPSLVRVRFGLEQQVRAPLSSACALASSSRRATRALPRALLPPEAKRAWCRVVPSCSCCCGPCVSSSKRMTSSLPVQAANVSTVSPLKQITRLPLCCLNTWALVLQHTYMYVSTGTRVLASYYIVYVDEIHAPDLAVEEV